MTDLGKALAVEAMDRTSWQADRNRRQARISGKSANNNHEKSLLRQYSDNNELRDYGENILLRVKELEVVAGEVENQFTAKNKEQLVKTLRGQLHLLYEQKTYLKLAEGYGYEAAEEFKSSDCDDKVVDESLRSRVNDIAKKYAPKAKAQNHQNYPKKPYQREQNAGQGPMMQSPMMQSPMMQSPMMMQPPYMMQSPMMQFPMPNGQMQNSMYGQSMPNQMGRFQSGYKPRFYNNNKRKFGGGIDKSRDTCKACGLIGHWAGDETCRGNQQEPLALPMPQGGNEFLHQFNQLQNY
jgi:hypothetical protein